MRFDAIELAGLDDGIDGGRAFAANLGSGEEPILSSKGHASHRSLGNVVIDENAANAVAFLKAAVTAFPFKVTHVLTDRVSCFTADKFERACVALGVQHRKTKPYTPKTNGMVERFNGRLAAEVLGITIHTHADLETLLLGFNQAYNNRRQRVLNGKSPNEVRN